MKKILVVFLSILVGCFSFCFFSCSNSKDNSSTENNSTENNSNNEVENLYADEKEVVDALMINITLFRNPASVRIVSAGHIFNMGNIRSVDLQINAQNGFGGNVTEWYQLWLKDFCDEETGKVYWAKGELEKQKYPTQSDSLNIGKLNEFLVEALKTNGWV